MLKRHFPVLLLILGSLPVQAATEHEIDESTGIERWHVVDDRIEVSLTQILPDQARAFFVNRGFTSEQAEVYAGACVYMTIVRNTGDEPLDFDMRDWSVRGHQSDARLKLRQEWMQRWAREALGQAERIAFEWSQFPTEQQYRPGDWNQGMTTIMTKPGAQFDLTLRWQTGQAHHDITLEGIRCAIDA
ncbi:MAG: hypothetical protein ACLFSG_05060 [Halothiobacillaceae bacterium]